jgi:hypothetical protein
MKESANENRTFYAEEDDGWATPCCGIGMWGDITENETLCPYCDRTFVFLDDDRFAEDDEETGADAIMKTFGYAVGN